MSTILEQDLWVGPPLVESRRRTVSHSVGGSAGVFREDRRTVSYAEGVVGMEEKAIQKQVNDMGSYLCDVKEGKGRRTEGGQLAWMGKIKKLPGLGILLVIAAVILGQISNVLVKKMTLDPFVLVLWRDVLRMVTIDTPLFTLFMVPPFPQGSRIMLVLRGIIAGLAIAVSAYAIRLLPLVDVSMILAIKPVFVTLLSCIFLKEACGVYEMFNLILVLGGITLVLQPPFIFTTSEAAYTPHMFYTALVLVAVTALSSSIFVILRHLRHLHWVTLAGSLRFFTLLEYLPVVLVLGTQCLPACGKERTDLLLLSIFASMTQALNIISLKFEEAHTISLVSNATNIVVAFVFQAVFFQEVPGLLKLLGAGVVLASVFLIGGRRVWQHRHQEKQEMLNTTLDK